MDTKRLRQRVLDLAIHGKLVPQNPQDEPASELLKRIAEEKERLIKDGKIKKSKKKANEDIDEVPFEVPQGWVWCRIDDIAYVTKLAGFEYTNYISDNISKNEGIPLFKGKNVQDGKVIYEFEAFIPEEISDILFRSQITKKCLLTPYVGTLGNIGIHDKKGKFHLGSNVGKIELFNDIEVKILEEYIRFYIMSSIGNKQLTKHKKATAQESISIESIRDIYVPLSPIAEQHRIVSEVEKYFSLIDILEESENDLQQSIQKAKSKILDLAIKGKLVEKTDEWEEKKLGDIGKWQAGATPSRANKSYYGGNIPWLKTGDLNDGFITEIPEYITEKALEETSVKLNPEGSVLVAMYGATIGKVGILTFPATTNQACCACINCSIDKMYLFYFLLANKEYFIRLGGGGAQPNISKEKIVNTPISVPHLAEQHQIVAKIEEIFTQLDNIAEALK